MEQEFYPFTLEDVSKLHPLVGEREIRKIFVPYTGNTTVASLRPLAVVLLQDINKFQELQESCLEDTRIAKRTGRKYVLGKFFELVKLWLKENNGRGNLIQLMEAVRPSGLRFFKALEKLILEYSLPLSTSGGAIEDIYSLSKDFLVEKREFAEERALSNPVVFDELFKQLEFNDKKSFRLVSSSWREETLRLWRKHARIHVTVQHFRDSWNEEREKEAGVEFSTFVSLLEEEIAKNAEAAKVGTKMEKEAGENMNYDWTNSKHPFRAYRLSFQRYYDITRMPFDYEEKSKVRFWELVGSQIEDLQISRAFTEGDENLYKFCKTLFLDKCQNLKKLNILKDYREGEMDEWNVKDVNAWWAEKNNWQKLNKDKMARNLHTLLLEMSVETNPMWNILFLCPYLKVLSYKTRNGKGLEALHYPAANGEIIKLEELTQQFTAHKDLQQDFLPLRKYIEILNSPQFSSLKRLHLLGICLEHARAAPYHFYSAIAQCSAILTTLEIGFNPRDDTDRGEDWKWFTDFSTISFPNLTQFKFYSDNRHEHFNYQKRLQQIIFDLSTLKRMPKLERLEIKVELFEKEQRSPGTKNWVFQGDRNRFIPEGVNVDYSSEPISCPNLRHFSFTGWPLNEEDINIFATWFPSLTYLNAEVDYELLPLLVEKWERLEKINIQTEQLITLRQLRPLNEKKRSLQINQTMTGVKLIQFVELKEEKGRLFFNHSETRNPMWVNPVYIDGLDF